MEPAAAVDFFPAVDLGRHNADLSRSISRITKGAVYKNAATILIVPTRGVISAKVVQAFMNLALPMNQPFFRIFVEGLEVGHAYSQAIQSLVDHPDFKTWNYILTMEEDNIPPPDGLLKLIESLDTDKHLGAVGGLYWTKGEGGQPMIYGDPDHHPRNFVPQIPRPGSLQYCNGLGMGFTLFRFSMFRDPGFSRPLFRTLQEFTPTGAKCFSQDLYFFDQANKCGWKFACDTRVLVGHYDAVNKVVW